MTPQVIMAVLEPPVHEANLINQALPIPMYVLLVMKKAAHHPCACGPCAAHLWILRMSTLLDSLGLGNSILRSMRPGRSSAESRMSMRLVAISTCSTGGAR
jgi:hypothetical protein